MSAVTLLLALLLLLFGLPLFFGVARLLSSARFRIDHPLAPEDRSLLRAGDVILVGRRAVWDAQGSLRDAAVSFLIQVANVLAHPRRRRFWTHVALYDGRGNLWEADQRGVVSTPIGEYFASDRYVLKALRHRFVPVSKLDEVVAWCAAQGDTSRYANRQVAHFILMNLLPVSLQWLLSSRWVERSFRHDDAFSCAELIVNAYRHVGYPVTARDGWRVSPVELLDSAALADAFEPWCSTVERARLHGLPGDLLTFAADPHPPFDRERILLAAADWLIELVRLEAARTVLEHVLSESHGESFEARRRLGFVLARLGDRERARGIAREALSQLPGHPEAQGLYGRLCKEMWRTLWETVPEAGDRMRTARGESELLDEAIRSYAGSAKLNLDYYNGVNVVSLGFLRAHLDASRSVPPAEELRDLIGLVRLAAERHVEDGSEEAIWARATLGEIELDLGNDEQACRWYLGAASHPRATPFQIDSIRDQLRMFERLEFRVPVVRELLARLPDGNGAASTSSSSWRASYRQVVVLAGHRIDAPGREEKRFPASSEGRVRARLGEVLDAMKVGEDTLALCGGAAGSDLLFAELCRERGARVRLQLPFPVEQHLAASVRDAGGAWEHRFRSLLAAGCEVSDQATSFGPLPEGTNPFERNNRWLLDVAVIEAAPRPPLAIVVWNGEKGDGPGGTAAFHAALRARGIEPRVIEPRG